MPRLQDTPTYALGSSTHLLWLATMGLRDHYLIAANRDDSDKTYSNNMRFLTTDLLVNIKRDNNNATQNDTNQE